MAYGVHAEVPALCHRVKELAEEFEEPGRLLQGLLQKPREQVLGKETDILGEETEDNPVEEESHVRRLQSTLTESVGYLGYPLGGFGRDRLAGTARLEPFGLEEDRTHDFHVAGRVELGQADFVNNRWCCREVCMDDEAVHVRYDQEWRVLQGFAVLQKLVVRLVEVLVLTLVFPTKEATLPDVGPALAAAVLARALLEGKPFALRIGLRRFCMAKDLTKVEEVLLRGRAFS